jgi:hypothetical protein
MPFEHLIPRPFVPGAIQAYAPMASGVYGISNALEWIYIGETDDIRGALLTHLGEFGSPLMRASRLDLCSRFAIGRVGRPARIVWFTSTDPLVTGTPEAP